MTTPWDDWGQDIPDTINAPQWSTMSEDEREIEYSPSSAIGGSYHPFIEAYVTRSNAARARCGDIITGHYGSVPSQTIDLILPPDASPDRPCPLLVFFHGGYWQELSKAESLFAAPDCIAQGLAFAAVDYTLAPRATLEQIVDECHRALLWLHDHAADYGYHPRQIIVSGSSAGGHLAAMCALPCWEDGQEHPVYLPAAAILVSGIFALEPLVGTSVNDALKLDTETARDNSPLLKDLTGFPPTVVACGRQETNEFIRQSFAFADALSANGTPIRTSIAENRNHFDVILDLTDPATPLGREFSEISRIVRTHHA